MIFKFSGEYPSCLLSTFFDWIVHRYENLAYSMFVHSLAFLPVPLTSHSTPKAHANNRSSSFIVHRLKSSICSIYEILIGLKNPFEKYDVATTNFRDYEEMMPKIVFPFK